MNQTQAESGKVPNASRGNPPGPETKAQRISNQGRSAQAQARIFHDVYKLFFNPGEVVEIRAYGLHGKSNAWSGWTRSIVHGYFDNPEDFARSAGALEAQKAPGIYFTINPVVEDLLARASNRLKAADDKTPATTDDYIKAIRWLPVDLDPRRPTGVSSSDEELARAKKLAKQIYKIGRRNGFPDPLPAMSGNGCHLCYRLPDLENTPDNVEDVKRCLVALATEVAGASPAVIVDQGVFNPARIWKIYGTTARKGDHTKKRPHRRSYIDWDLLIEARKETDDDGGDTD